jgi:hypothetical protein
MWRVDSFLIDRVFQPVVDALASLVSCYALAAFVLTGAGLCFAVSYYHAEQWLALALAGVWVPVPIVRAHRLDQERPRAVLSNERVTGFYARIWFLFVQVVFGPSVVLLLLTKEGDVWILLNEAGWWMLLVGLYLMACRRPPPSQQPARRAWFGWLTPLATNPPLR